MYRPRLDVTKSLYDSDGYHHTLVRATPLQVLTQVQGFLFLWDRLSGRCLMEGMGGAQLSNTRPADADLRALRDPVAETRAFLLARDAIQTATTTAAASLLAQKDAPATPPRRARAGKSPRTPNAGKAA